MKYQIITVNREFESDGNEIAQQVAKALHLPYIDHFLVTEAAIQSGRSEQRVSMTDELLASRFEYSQAEAANYYASGKSPLPTTAQIAEVQFQIIRDQAAKGPCLIVGRCADYVLRERNDVLNVFIHSGRDYRVKRAMERLMLGEKEAVRLLKRTDKNRKAYYKNYTGREWNDPSAYHIMLNSNLLSQELCVKIICDAYQGAM